MSLWPGELLAGGSLPKIEQSLGAGSLGATFVARHPESPERLALTQLHAVVTDSAEFRHFEQSGGFARVRAMQGELGEARLVPKSSLFAFEGTRALVSPLFPGEDIRRFRGRSLSEILSTFDPLLRLIARLHRDGIAHGGLHAANLLCDEQGRICVDGLGWCGLAHRIPEVRSARIEAAGAGLSPALLAGQAEVEPSDDVFALGALLYEWISGRPPPISRAGEARVLPPLSVSYSAPQSSGDVGEVLPRPLAVRVSSMLAANVGDRPTSLLEVAEELAAIRTTLPEDESWDRVGRRGNTEEADGAGGVSPATLSPSKASSGASAGPALSGTRSSSSSSGTARRRWVGLAAFALVGMVTLVLLEQFSRPIPEVVPDASVAEARADAEPEEAEVVAPVPAPAPALTGGSFAQERRWLELRESFERLQAGRLPYVERDAERWAPEAFARAFESGEAFGAAIESRDLPAAEAIEIEAEAALADLVQETSRRLKGALEEGEAALDRDESEAARVAFKLALQIDPDNTTAVRGLEGAALREEVLRRMAEAEARAREAGGIPAALEVARGTMELDPRYRPAQDLVAALERRQAQAALSRALSGDRERAERFRREERWSEAIGEFERALERSPSASFARDALPEARARASLDADLQGWLEDPDRVFSRTGRDGAERSVLAARAVVDAGPRLQSQLRTLVAILERANTPVVVRLVSDGETEVTIFHVGRQGTFNEKTLELLPGMYTVVGSRDGYRDVRQEFRVESGAANALLRILCEDAL